VSLTYIWIALFFYDVIMPLAWIHSLSKQQAEQLSTELGVSVEGTLDDLRKRLREKLSSLEQHLPSQLQAKSEPATDAGTSVGSGVQSVGVPGRLSYIQAKMRGRVVGDLVKNMPVLSDADPESVLEVYDLNLVGDVEFLALLVGRTSGRVSDRLSPSGHIF
jgi:hypothetical protein